jgi:isopenicillin-N N-acyltransferase-like protein
VTAPAHAATRFPVLDVRGSPRELGRQIGEARRDHIRELTGIVLERANRSRTSPVSPASAAAIAASVFPLVEAYSPDSAAEVRGTAEGAGVTPEQVMLLNARNMLSPADDAAAATSAGGCTSVMVSAKASATRAPIAGQNWDNDPAMSPYSVVLIRRPLGKPANMTWTQPGLIAYIGMNSSGLGVLMNALNGPSRSAGVPWYFIVRALLEQHDLAGAVAAAERAPRAITANAAMVTPGGAVDIEVTPASVRVINEDNRGTLVHTNHCVHPQLTAFNQRYADRIFGQSVERKARAESILAGQGGAAGVETLKGILADHDGYPTSICRHPNADPLSGWQRSVVSIILEPSAGRMHVSRGNPCEAPFETYNLN